MIKIFFKSLNYLVEFNDNIVSMNIENVIMYRKIIFNLEDEIILSIDDKEYLASKNVLFISNPLDIDINSKKLVTALLKDLSANISEDNKRKLNEIETEIIKILDDISYESSFKIQYSNELNIMNIFSIYNVCFSDISFDNYLELFLTYIKINCEYFKYKVIIVNNLIDILTKEEYNDLVYELKIEGIYLLNLECKKENYHNKKIIVDDDLCII